MASLLCTHPTICFQYLNWFSHLQTLKLNVAALKQAAEIPFALYEGLRHLDDAITRLKEASTIKKVSMPVKLHSEACDVLLK